MKDNEPVSYTFLPSSWLRFP